MKEELILLLLLFCGYSGSVAQDRYIVSWEQATYDTIINYRSLLKEEYDFSINEIEDHELEFGFDFPYFDKTFDRFFFDANGYGYFPDNEFEYNLYLYGSSYENFGLYDAKYLSDIRYNSEMTDTLGIFKIEWKNVGFNYAILDNNYPSHSINYQTWFNQ